MPEPMNVPPKTRGLTAMTGAMSLILVLLMMQIWLLSAALEAFLEGERGAALPAAIFSGACFVMCVALYLFVNRIDEEVHTPASSSETPDESRLQTDTRSVQP